MGFVLFNFSVCLYSGFQYNQMNALLTTSASASPGAISIIQSDKNLLKSVLMAIPIIVAVFTVVFAFFAFKLYLEFGWKIYKKIGADPKMRSELFEIGFAWMGRWRDGPMLICFRRFVIDMYRVYQIFIMLLKLDIFFVFGFGIQFIVLVINQYDPEFGLTIAALPITMLFLVFAVYGVSLCDLSGKDGWKAFGIDPVHQVRREDKLIMTLFCAGLLLAMAYFIFKLVRIWQRKNDDKYMDTKNYLTFFGMD